MLDITLHNLLNFQYFPQVLQFLISPLSQNCDIDANFNLHQNKPETCDELYKALYYSYMRSQIEKPFRNHSKNISKNNENQQQENNSLLNLFATRRLSKEDSQFIQKKLFYYGTKRPFHGYLTEEEQEEMQDDLRRFIQIEFEQYNYMPSHLSNDETNIAYKQQQQPSNTATKQHQHHQQNNTSRSIGAKLN
jgi:hypothetical protein